MDLFQIRLILLSKFFEMESLIQNNENFKSVLKKEWKKESWKKNSIFLIVKWDFTFQSEIHSKSFRE